MKRLSRKSAAVAIFVAFFAVALVVGGTLAYLTQRTGTIKNVFELTQMTILVDYDNGSGNYTVKNTGQMPAMVRISVAANLTHANSQVFYDDEMFVITPASDAWEQAYSHGYYYYKAILSAGETVDFGTVELTDGAAALYGDHGSIIHVAAEGVQYEDTDAFRDALEVAWGDVTYEGDTLMITKDFKTCNHADYEVVAVTNEGNSYHVHARRCKRCDMVLFDHSYEQFTYKSDGPETHSRTCTIKGCDYSMGEEAHVSAYKYVDADKHQEVCLACGEILNAELAVHSYTPKIISGNVEVHNLVCACLMDMTDPTSSYKTEGPHEWQLNSNEGQHGNTCSICSYYDYNSFANHTYTVYVSKNENSHTYKCSGCPRTQDQEHTLRASIGPVPATDKNYGHHLICSDANCAYNQEVVVPHTLNYFTPVYLQGTDGEGNPYDTDVSMAHRAICCTCEDEVGKDKCPYCDPENMDTRNGCHECPDCQGCGYPSFFPNITFPHNFDTVFVEDADYHYNVCRDCGYKEAPQAHVWQFAGLNQDNTKHLEKCSVCEMVRESEHTRPAVLVNRGENGHAWVCGEPNCRQEIDPAKPHDFTSTEDTANPPMSHKLTCATCGYATQEAHQWEVVQTSEGEGDAIVRYHHNRCTVCGYEDTSSKNEHRLILTNDILPNGQSAHRYECETCDYFSTGVHSFTVLAYQDNFGHAYRCSVCGMREDKMYDHTMVYTKGTAKHTAECTVCDYAITTAVACTYAMTDLGNGTHNFVCILCGNVKTAVAHTEEYVSVNDVYHEKICKPSDTAVNVTGCDYHVIEAHVMELVVAEGDYGHYFRCKDYDKGCDYKTEVIPHAVITINNGDTHSFGCRFCSWKVNNITHVYNETYGFEDEHFHLCTVDCGGQKIACGASHLDGNSDHEVINYYNHTDFHEIYCSCGVFVWNLPHNLKKADGECQHMLSCACGYTQSAVSYTSDTEGHSGTCVACDAVVVAKTAHTFVNGRCTTCTYVTHICAVSYYTNNGDGTHTPKCACGVIMSDPVAHTYVSTELIDGSHTAECVCGAECNGNNWLSHIPVAGKFEHTSVCGTCGFTRVYAHRNVTGYTDNGNGTHTAICVDCGSFTETHVIQTDAGTAEKHTFTCACGYSQVDQDHSFEYVYIDGDKHLVYCICGYEAQTAHNVFVDNGDGTHSCACGTGTVAHTWMYDELHESTHTRTCTVCGHKDEDLAHNWVVDLKGESVHRLTCECGHFAIEAHTYEYSNIGEHTHTETCTICGVVHQNKVHLWENGDDVSNHIGTCSCGKKEPDSAHLYTYTDNGDGTHLLSCSCGNLEITHDNEYTFTSDTHTAICTSCSFTAAAVAHTYSGYNTEAALSGGYIANSPTYSCIEEFADNNHARACSTCGYTVSAAHTFSYGICTTCNSTQVRHGIYMSETDAELAFGSGGKHNVETSRKKATNTENGYITFTATGTDPYLTVGTRYFTGYTGSQIPVAVIKYKTDVAGAYGQLMACTTTGLDWGSPNASTTWQWNDTSGQWAYQLVSLNWAGWNVAPDNLRFDPLSDGGIGATSFAGRSIDVEYIKFFESSLAAQQFLVQANGLTRVNGLTPATNGLGAVEAIRQTNQTVYGSGWAVTSNYQTQYVFSVDGSTWYACSAIGWVPDDYVAIYNAALASGVQVVWWDNARYEVLIDLSSWAGQTVTLHLGVVDQSNMVVDFYQVDVAVPAS